MAQTSSILWFWLYYLSRIALLKVNCTLNKVVPKHPTKTIHILSPKELALRFTGLYAGLIISNAFGNVRHVVCSLQMPKKLNEFLLQLMAAGVLGGMEEKLGIRAWRWWVSLRSPFYFANIVRGQVVLY